MPAKIITPEHLGPMADDTDAAEATRRMNALGWNADGTTGKWAEFAEDDDELRRAWENDLANVIEALTRPYPRGH